MESLPQAPAPEDVSEAVRGWLSARFGGEITTAGPPARISGGFDFWIYSLHFAGSALPAEWTAPIVARVPPTPERFPLLQAESDLQDWTSRHGYKAPRVRAVLAPHELLAQPVQLVDRVPGRPMAEEMTSAPWRIPRLIGSLAALHARLHRLPLPSDDGSTTSVVERRLGLVRFAVERVGDSELAAGLERVEQLIPKLEVPDPVICHGDFHPRNVLVEEGSASVIDWTDAGVGDRHADIARTAWLFRFAAAAAPSRVERSVMAATAPYLARRYLADYQRHAPIDPARLRLWQPLHLIHAWAMAVADDAELVGPSRAGKDFHRGLASWAKENFWEAVGDLAN